MNLSKEHDRKGLVATILIHTILFLLMLIWTMGQAEDMLDAEAGVEVSFGTSMDAGGASDISQVSETTEETPASAQSPSAETADEAMVTNDQTDAPEIDAAETTTKQTNTTQTTKETTQTAEEDKPNVNNAKNAVNEYFKNKKNSDQTSSSGTGDKPGIKGSDDATNAGPGGSGKGLTGSGYAITGIGGKGVGFGVGYAHTPENQQRETGKIILKFCIDRSGNLVSKPTLEPGSTGGSYLYNLSVDALKKFRFTPNPNMSSGECAFITFNYSLQ